jgi:hypothetical protein
MARLIESMRARSEETAAELEKIKSCPAPCRDCAVTVRPPSFAPQRVACPVVDSECAYGSAVSRSLAAHLVKIMQGADVPTRHLENFANRRHSIASSEARKWLGRGFLVLVGPPGVGKSFGAAWGVQGYLRGKVSNWLDRSTWAAAEKAGESVLWLSAKDIADDKALAAKASCVDLLALDDLGKEDDTKTGQAAVRGVISKRYDGKLAAIVTTELSVGDIEARYGRYIAERLAEDTRCGGMVIGCGDVSMRIGGAG